MTNTPKLRFKEFNGEWKVKKFGDITVKTGIKNKNSEDYEVYSISNKYGFIPQGEQFENSRLSELDKTLYQIVSKGEFAYNPARINVGSIGLLEEDKTVIVSSLYVCFKLLDGMYYRFFKTYFDTSKFNKDVMRNTEGSVREYLFYENFSRIKVQVPDLDEQEKIASFFSLIDKKIELQTEKVEELKKYKKGIMQKIFSRELRFKDDNGDEFPSWRKGKIHDCFLERSEKGFEDLELLSVSMERGVIKRSDIEGKDNSSENKSNYKLVKKDDIVYNSMRMWQGASGLSEYEGIVSPAYTILTPKKDIDSSYFAYLFKMYNMIYEFKKYSQGLTSDTWNLKYPQIKDIKVNIPAYEEQIKISQFFKKIDTKLNKEQEKLDRLLEYKKGLLQQMFV